MITLTIISGVLFLIGTVLILIYFTISDIEWMFIVGIILMFVFGISTLVFGIIGGNRTNATKIKEYPASKYTLSYKITECGSQKDTTYVLIPKEK